MSEPLIVSQTKYYELMESSSFDYYPDNGQSCWMGQSVWIKGTHVICKRCQGETVIHDSINCDWCGERLYFMWQTNV